jgi:hypothetical protein
MSRLVIVLIFVATISVGWWFISRPSQVEWDVVVSSRAPVYASRHYPYGTASRPNPVVGYLEPGAAPKVLGVYNDKPWPVYEVKLPSGVDGFLFAVDVDAKSRPR